MSDKVNNRPPSLSEVILTTTSTGTNTTTSSTPEQVGSEESSSSSLHLQTLQISPTMNIQNASQSTLASLSLSTGKNKNGHSQSHGHSRTPPRIRIGGLSGIKEKPVCNVPALRKENMSAEQLSLMCFKLEEVLVDVDKDKGDRGDGNLNGTDQKSESDDDGATSTGNLCQMQTEMTTVITSMKEWESLKRATLNRTESRNGRDLQRFEFATGSGTPTGTGSASGSGSGVMAAAGAGTQTEKLFRLTTGSVPIMRDGRILLVSSSRKEEWILPKGGWESDESLEVSALRETYEEGGILGIVGPRLTGIEYETRKGKKRRLEFEASLKKKYEIAYSNSGPGGSAGGSGQSDGNHNGDGGHGNGNGHVIAAISTPSANSSTCPSEDGECMQMQTTTPPATGSSPSLVGNKNSSSILLNNHSEHGHDNASLGSIASVTSDGSAYCAHVRMYMFPMYVLEVREHWPESGRARKVVDIDTAIEMMASRPEFQKVLMEVKERGYHLKPCVGKTYSQQSDLQATPHVVI